MLNKIRFCKLLIGMTSLVLFCSFQTTAQVPENPVKEIPPPPPPPPEPSVEEIFEVIAEMPKFIGCEDTLSRSEKNQCISEKMYEYIYANLKYPKLARENNIEGTVVVRFYVDKDGSIKAPELLKDIGAGCGKEALRVIESMRNSDTIIKKFTPGKSRSKPIKTYFNLPIKFDLEQFRKNNE